ncbi:MAG: Ornithine carbamoyltransferase [Alphaproteobacteria bacterium ADurb.Bin438]|nr:MAG: Ornithine carbamoyltransferase [Alphaproteobacteria bacterium ADurb.Bin438]
MKDLLKISDLNSVAFKKLIDLAIEFKKNPFKSIDLLKGETVTLYFSKSSLRTRVSFETAVVRLGGHPITTTSNDYTLGQRETIHDVAKNVERFSKAYVIRTYKDSDVEEFAKHATIPVVNALTDGHHPCQALADIMTMIEHGKKSIAYFGDANNVAISLMEACVLMGYDFKIASPEGYDMPKVNKEWAIEKALTTGSKLTFTNDPIEAAKDVDALYSDVWMSMGDDKALKDVKFKALAPYQVNEELYKHSNDGAIFLHCLPAHRGEEVSEGIIDGPMSKVFDEAENRLHTAQAVLFALLTKAI